jgi:hypothetical protein
MLQWADTFNRYGTNNALLLNGLYAENIGRRLPAPCGSGHCSAAVVFKCGSNWPFTTTQGLRYVLSSNQPTVGMAGKLWMSALFPAKIFNAVLGMARRVEHHDCADASEHGRRARGLSMQRGRKSEKLRFRYLVANAWNHIEAKVFRSATVGTFEVRVNGAAAVLSLTGLGARRQRYRPGRLRKLANGTNVGTIMLTYYKDIVIWDGTGTYNKDFMGTCSVLDIDTDSDVVLGWTPNPAGTGFSILDNNPPTDDAAYIGAAAAALTNTFGLSNLPADVTTVRGGVIVNRSRKIDGGDGNVQAGLISGASTGLGADRPITVAYTYYKDVFEVDPNTGVPFIPANFNLAKLKLTRTV